MASQVIIRLAPELKARMVKLARAEGKTTSAVLRELVEKYVRERDISSYIDDLWSRTARKLKRQGVGPSEVRRAIREVRKRKP